MRRNTHYMRVAKSNRLPRSVVCVVTEDRQGGEVGWQWRSCVPCGPPPGKADRAAGFGADSLWEALRKWIKRNGHTWLVLMGACHELARLGFWDQLEEDRWKLVGDDKPVAPPPGLNPDKWFDGYCVLEDPPTCILCKPARGPGRLTVIDVRNYGVSGWPALEPPTRKADDEATAAGFRAWALREFMDSVCRTIKANALGGLKLTAASQAMHTYRRRFLRSPLLVHCNLAALADERAAVHAGRNECYKLGLIPGPVYQLDVNSCYPAAASGQLMPARLVGHHQGKGPDPRTLTERGFQCIAVVTLETSEPHFPVKFSWQRHGESYARGKGGVASSRPNEGDTIFPVGTFHTALCGPELEIAYRLNCVRKVWSVAWYEPAELFTGWCREWSRIADEAKASGVPGLSEWVKRVRNSLFGKFAQWGWRWERCDTVFADRPFSMWYGPPPIKPGDNDVPAPPKDHYDQHAAGSRGKVVRYRSIGWSVQVELGLGEHPESCPAIAGWVYSLARVRLMGLMDEAGRGHVYYVDADSLWVDNTGYQRLVRAGLVEENVPGKLKLVKVHDWLTMHGLKCYSLPGQTVAAGLPEHARPTGKGGWSFWVPESPASALLNNRHPGEEKMELSYKRPTVYRHGVADSAGRVLPHTLSER